LDLAQEHRQVTREQAQAYVRDILGITHPVHEVSAKDAIGEYEMWRRVG
jgi:hypothetical protein